MTISGLLRLSAQRWYIFAIGFFCAIFGFMGVNTGQQIFVSETEFAMVPPVPSVDYVPPDDTQQTLISFADIVARTLNAEDATVVLSSPTATLFGNGIRRGVSASLANGGTQWTSSHGSPIITVQVVDSTGEAVQMELDAITERVERITRELQVATGAKPASFITAETDASRTSINSFGPTRTSKLKGAVVMFAVALCASTIVAEALERRKSLRKRQNSWSLLRPHLGAPSPTQVSKESSFR